MLYVTRFLLIFALSLGYAQGASPEIVVYSGVPCGLAASIIAACAGSKHGEKNFNHDWNSVEKSFSASYLHGNENA